MGHAGAYQDLSESMQRFYFQGVWSYNVETANDEAGLDRGGGQVVYLVDSNDNWEQEEKEHIYEEAG